MRVIECNECGETIAAADDDELVARLATHLADEHRDEPGEAQLVELVDDQAYDATDA